MYRFIGMALNKNAAFTTIANIIEDSSVLGCYAVYTGIQLLTYEDKGKAIPLQALTGPEGSRRLRLTNF
jgi:hypothetical protein